MSVEDARKQVAALIRPGSMLTFNDIRSANGLPPVSYGNLTFEMWKVKQLKSEAK